MTYLSFFKKPMVRRRTARWLALGGCMALLGGCGKSTNSEQKPVHELKPLVSVRDVPGESTKRVVIVGEEVTLRPTAEMAQLYAGDGSIGEVIIETEKLSVTGRVAMPGATVLIQTRFLTFGDGGTSDCISVQPLPITGKPAAASPTETAARNGRHGTKGPDFLLYAEKIEAPGDERRLDLRGGIGQDAGEGRAGIGTGAAAVPSGLPGPGGDGGTFYGSGDTEFIRQHIHFVDTAGGANGGKGQDYPGGPGVQWRVRDGGVIGAVFNTGHYESIAPGPGALAPILSTTAAGGKTQSLEQVAPAGGALDVILEFLQQVHRENPSLAKIYAQQYLARTASWEEDAGGNSSPNNLSAPQHEFRQALGTFLR